MRVRTPIGPRQVTQVEM